MTNIICWIDFLFRPNDKTGSKFFFYYFITLLIYVLFSNQYLDMTHWWLSCSWTNRLTNSVLSECITTILLHICQIQLTINTISSRLIWRVVGNDISLWWIVFRNRRNDIKKSNTMIRIINNLNNIYRKRIYYANWLMCMCN